MNSKNSVRRKLTALLMALVTGLAAVIGEIGRAHV